jgi:hypothetical protein
MPVVDVVQVARLVNTCCVVSIKCPVAANCRVNPLAILALGGDKEIVAKEEVWNVAKPVFPS